VVHPGEGLWILDQRTPAQPPRNHRETLGPVFGKHSVLRLPRRVTVATGVTLELKRSPKKWPRRRCERVTCRMLGSTRRLDFDLSLSVAAFYLLSLLVITLPPLPTSIAPSRHHTSVVARLTSRFSLLTPLRSRSLLWLPSLRNTFDLYAPLFLGFRLVQSQ